MWTSSQCQLLLTVTWPNRYWLAWLLGSTGGNRLKITGCRTASTFYMRRFWGAHVGILLTPLAAGQVESRYMAISQFWGHSLGRDFLKENAALIGTLDPMGTGLTATAGQMWWNNLRHYRPRRGFHTQTAGEAIGRCPPSLSFWGAITSTVGLEENGEPPRYPWAYSSGFGGLVYSLAPERAMLGDLLQA